MRSQCAPGSTGPRGFTLLEMLVVVVLVVLMMTIFTTIFAAATGALAASRALQELDQSLRRLDGTIRGDLRGVTARLTPPLNPRDNLGYFEYGENAFADAQGEDTDDYLRFTAQAPKGEPFVGRIWMIYGSSSIQPVAVTSEFAEVIYFVRNGNLYRRVLLIAPERRATIGLGPRPFGGYNFSAFGPVSWLGMHDLSAHPSPTKLPNTTPLPNTLGDLTNRENRFASPRFRNDFYPLAIPGFSASDGIPDDNNSDGIPDSYPTLYPNVFKTGLVHEATAPNRVAYSYDTMPFPFLFPGMYSQADPLGAGLIHSVDPTGATFNHCPLDFGDSLPIPTKATQYQTWWGFPTWRETMSQYWGDPVNNVSDGMYLQTMGLSRYSPNFFLLPAQPGGFSDNAGSSKFTPPAMAWEDDLLVTDVRSFDVKAYDPAAQCATVASPTPADYVNLGSGYFDLGYQTAYVPGLVNVTPPGMLKTFGHEGRIPPLVADNRADPHWSPFYNRNIGDDGTEPGSIPVLRLRRVFDTWSTDYTQAPDVPLNPLLGPPSAPPVYPSYPPPYAAPLRGLQIQLRITDPDQTHIRVLTIRHDFSDRL